VPRVLSLLTIALLAWPSAAEEGDFVSPPAFPERFDETPEAPEPQAPKPQAPKPQAPKPQAPKPQAPKPKAPKPTPKPKPAGPAKVPAAAVQVSPPLAPAASVPTAERSLDPRTVQLERDLDAALATEPPDAATLERLCTAWQPARTVEESPLLAARLPLCAGRASLLERRLDQAEERLDRALAAASALPASDGQRALEAEIRFRLAEVAEERFIGFERCGTALSLLRLASWESKEASARLDLAVSRYEDVVRVRERHWARRALLKTAALAARFYEQVASSAGNYRRSNLPSPFRVERVDAAALLARALGPKDAAWPREIARLYRVLEDELVRTGDDPALLEEVRHRAAALAGVQLPAQGAENPWLPALRPGVLRWARRSFEARAADGTWQPLDDALARERAKVAASQEPLGVEGAWALVALAASGAPVEVELLERALNSDDERVQLAGLAASSERPQAEHYEPLVTFWKRLAVPEGAPLFATLESALFARPERALLALRALVERERDLGPQLALDARIPLAERAWLLAELGDTRMLNEYQRLAQQGERTASAVALYGWYLAAGRGMLGSLRPNDPEPAGCVSRHLARMHAETASLAD
jgi:hypothetical protein